MKYAVIAISLMVTGLFISYNISAYTFSMFIVGLKGLFLIGCIVLLFMLLKFGVNFLKEN